MTFITSVYPDQVGRSYHPAPFSFGETSACKSDNKLPFWKYLHCRCETHTQLEWHSRYWTSRCSERRVSCSPSLTWFQYDKGIIFHSPVIIHEKSVFFLQFSKFLLCTAASHTISPDPFGYFLLDLYGFWMNCVFHRRSNSHRWNRRKKSSSARRKNICTWRFFMLY